MGVFFVPDAEGGEATPLLATSSPSSLSSSASESFVDAVEGCLSIIVGLGEEVPDPFGVAALPLPFAVVPLGVDAPFVDGEVFLD